MSTFDVRPHGSRVTRFPIPHVVVVIYCHLSKLSVGQTPRQYSLPSKSYSNNINVPFTGGGNLVKESGEPFNGMPKKKF